MRIVLCYGDSNTWGYDPQTGNRFPKNQRWTGVCQSFLGSDFQLIEEGLNGRTTVWDDPIEGFKNGETYLIPCLDSHRPLDLVVIMLGTNDLKVRFSLSAYDVACGVGKLLHIVQHSEAGINGSAPKVLIIAPPVVEKVAGGNEVFEGARPKSEKFARYYQDIAAQYQCDFLDAGQVIVSSKIDGIHFEAGQHHKLGQAVARKIKAIFG